MRVVVTSAITLGSALVGAFSQGGAVFRRSGVTVEATNSHSTWFADDITAIRAEERLALAVYRESAFTVVTGLSSAIDARTRNTRCGRGLFPFSAPPARQPKETHGEGKDLHLRGRDARRRSRSPTRVASSTSSPETSPTSAETDAEKAARRGQPRPRRRIEEEEDVDELRSRPRRQLRLRRTSAGDGPFAQPRRRPARASRT